MANPSMALLAALVAAPLAACSGSTFGGHSGRAASVQSNGTGQSGTPGTGTSTGTNGGGGSGSATGTGTATSVDAASAGTIGPGGAELGAPLSGISTSDFTIDDASCQDVTATQAAASATCPDGWLAIGGQYTGSLPDRLDSLRCCQLKYQGKTAQKVACTTEPFAEGQYISCPYSTWVAGLQTAADGTPTGISCCSYSFDATHYLSWGTMVATGETDTETPSANLPPINGVITYSDGQVHTCPGSNQAATAVGDNLVPDDAIDNFSCFNPGLSGVPTSGPSGVYVPPPYVPSLAGTWTSSGQTVTVQQTSQITTEYNLTITSGGNTYQGSIITATSVYIPSLTTNGQIAADGKTITWSDGATWTRQ